MYNANEKVEPVNVAEEVSRSFLDYSMSVIISRALPDARDGLKPSQRRILYAMHELSLFPGRKPYKCAKICGDTSGNYHPPWRSGDLSDSRPHGAAVGHAGNLDRRQREFRFSRRRSAGSNVLHRSANDASRRRAYDRHGQRHGELCPKLR